MKVARDTDALQGSTELLDPAMDRAVRFASEVKRRWRDGTAPDANAILTERPELLRYRSLVLDLAVEEYKQRHVTGESISADEFAARFPDMERSLYFLLEVQRMMARDSSLDIIQDEIIWPKPGDAFLGFSLLAELGQGTFGRVFLCSEPSLGDRRVALKVAPHGQCEAEILGKLAHPNIVPVYSIQKDPQTGLTAICMPYLGPVTLLDIIERAFVNRQPPRGGRIFADILRERSESENMPLPADFDLALTRGSFLDAVVHLAVQLADALAFTHKQGIFHRDLKPSNILLSKSGRPLILDFNLSTDEKISPARLGGTLPYMSPEQLQGMLTDCSSPQTFEPAQSDIFSLGVILYELTTGALPFGLPNMKGSWEDVAEDLLARQQKGPQPLRASNPAIDGRMASLIEDCLAFDPNARPATAESLANLLHRQNSRSRRARRWARRHPFVLASSGLSLLLCGLWCGIWLALRDPYPIRQYREGLAQLQRGEPVAAIERFNAALLVVPDNRDILLERGKAYYRLEKYSQAREDFRQLEAISPSGEVVALQGHCLCRMKLYPEAINLFNKAVAAGYETTSLFNNLGYCYMQKAKLSDAERCFHQAISSNSRCATAWHNLVKISLKRFDQEKIDYSQALELIENALNAETPTADLYLDVSNLESRLAEKDPKIISRVFEHLKKAVSLGIDPRRIARDGAFDHLRNQPEFSALLERSPGIKANPATDGIASPF
jgi:eukaryotic-like serine/threonine-protein kinase